jgi:hypothetical protein
MNFVIATIPELKGRGFVWVCVGEREREREREEREGARERETARESRLYFELQSGLNPRNLLSTRVNTPCLTP